MSAAETEHKVTIQHKALRTLAEAATPGPWFADSDYGTVTAEPYRSARDAYWRDYSLDDEPWVVPESMGSGVGSNNLEFIAAANPAVVLSLLDALAEAERKTEIAQRPHGVAWQDRLNIICLCGKVCGAVVRKSVAGGFIGRPGSDTYVEQPAAQVFANHLWEMNHPPTEASLPPGQSA